MLLFETLCANGNINELDNAINELKSINLSIPWGNGISLALQNCHIDVVKYLIEKTINDASLIAKKMCDDILIHKEIDEKKEADIIMHRTYYDKYWEFLMYACRSIHLDVIKYAFKIFKINKINCTMWNLLITIICNYCNETNNIQHGIECVKYILKERFHGKTKHEIKYNNERELDAVRCYCNCSNCILFHTFGELKDDYIYYVLKNHKDPDNIKIGPGCEIQTN